MARRVAGGRSEEPIAELIACLSREQLQEIVAGAADRHDDVERAVRLMAARSSGDLAALRAEVDGGLRTRRFLDYRGSMEWARAGRPVVAELERLARTKPSAELVELVQRAVGHVVKVIEHADDSSGLIGDLARDLLDVHAVSCDAGAADPVKLAAWMIRFRFVDQSFFEVDPVRYASPLGEEGMTVYRKAVDDGEGIDSFALRYARERLAVLDGDIDLIVELGGGDLSNAYQFCHVAEMMAELGRDDLVLAWTRRGIAETDGWQVGALYDLACDTHARRGEPLEVLCVRRAQHERMASLSTYTALRAAAEAVEAWGVERSAARVALKSRDVQGYVDALLRDGDAELAWDVAVAASSEQLGADRWLRLAESREADRPGDALAVYQRVADEILLETDRRAYASAVRILKRARSAAHVAGEGDRFAEHVAQLRERCRRRPTLIAMLDKASLP